jgi:hypothetical protein
MQTGVEWTARLQQFDGAAFVIRACFAHYKNLCSAQFITHASIQIYIVYKAWEISSSDPIHMLHDLVKFLAGSLEYGWS